MLDPHFFIRFFFSFGNIGAVIPFGRSASPPNISNQDFDYNPGMKKIKKYNKMYLDVSMYGCTVYSPIVTIQLMSFPRVSMRIGLNPGRSPTPKLVSPRLNNKNASDNKRLIDHNIKGRFLCAASRSCLNCRYT